MSDMRSHRNVLDGDESQNSLPYSSPYPAMRSRRNALDGDNSQVAMPTSHPAETDMNSWRGKSVIDLKWSRGSMKVVDYAEENAEDEDEDMNDGY